MTLLETITEEQFAQLEGNRIRYLDSKFKDTYLELQKNPQSLQVYESEKINPAIIRSEFHLRNLVSGLYPLTKIYNEKGEQEKLQKVQSSKLVSTAREYLGEVALVFYQGKALTKPKFLEALKQDLDYINKNKDSQDSKTKLNAARRLEFLHEIFLLTEFKEESLEVIRISPESFQLWIEKSEIYYKGPLE